MNNTVVYIAFAGLATGALAQDFSLSLVGPTNIEGGVPFEIEVYGDSTFGTHLAGGGFSLESNSSLVNDISWVPASWSAFNEDSEGYLGNGNYGQVVFGQLLLPFPGLDTPGVGSELGGLIGTYFVTIQQLGHIDFNLVAASPFTLETIDIATFESAQDVDGTLTLNGLSITPAPSSVALLGLGGLVATRRRR